MYTSRANAYKDNEILATSREQLVPLMYRHLLTNLRKADRQIRAKDIQGKAESLSRASDIVYELLASLRVEEAGELGQRLAALYAYFSNEIRQIGRTLDVARLERLIELVDGLHLAWAEAARIVEARPDEQPDSMAGGFA